MSNDQQRPFQPDQPGRPVPPPTPEGGWGGEYDGDSTAFIQLPGDLPGPYRHGYADGSGGMPEPLAAPGTGQGWEPPAIDPQAYQASPGQEPLTPAATTDPAAPGQWTMPFAGSPAEPAPEEGDRPSPSQGGVAAALGQGAAAALAGSQQARDRQRRPLGEGGQLSREAQAADGPEGTHGAAHGAAHDGTPGGTREAAREGAQPSGTDWSAVPAPGATGQWSIPFAAAGSPDDSGEYLAAAAAGRVPEPPPVREPRAPEPSGDAPGEETPDAASDPAPDAPEEPRDRDQARERDRKPDAPEAGLPEPPVPEPPPADAPVPEASAVDSEHPHVSYVLRVNGADRPVTDAWIGESLLYVLRERLGLAGAKDGCSQGECGACSVQVDGRLVASCLVPAATAAGSEIRTVEGLAENGTPCDVQRALVACGAVQCGFCVPGMAMTLHDLLEGNHAPTELEARQAISGNLCRCSGYRGVLDAVRTVVAERDAASTAFAEAREAEAEARRAEHDEGTGQTGGNGDGPRIRIPHQAGPHQPGPAGGGHPPHDHHLPQDGGAQ